MVQNPFLMNAEEAALLNATNQREQALQFQSKLLQEQHSALEEFRGVGGGAGAGLSYSSLLGGAGGVGGAGTASSLSRSILGAGSSAMASDLYGTSAVSDYGLSHHLPTDSLGLDHHHHAGASPSRFSQEQIRRQTMKALQGAQSLLRRGDHHLGGGGISEASASTAASVARLLPDESAVEAALYGRGYGDTAEMDDLLTSRAALMGATDPRFSSTSSAAAAAVAMDYADSTSTAIQQQILHLQQRRQQQLELLDSLTNVQPHGAGSSSLEGLKLAAAAGLAEDHVAGMADPTSLAGPTSPFLLDHPMTGAGGALSAASAAEHAREGTPASSTRRPASSSASSPSPRRSKGKLSDKEEEALSIPPTKSTKAMRAKKSGKPSRPLSAYNIFFKQERQRLIQWMQTSGFVAPKTPEEEDNMFWVMRGLPHEKPSEDDEATNTSTSQSVRHQRKKKPHGCLGFKLLAKAIGQRWKDLSLPLRGHYSKLAAVDMARYRAQLETWKAQQAKQLRTKPKSKVNPQIQATLEGKGGLPGGYVRSSPSGGAGTAPSTTTPPAASPQNENK